VPEVGDGALAPVQIAGVVPGTFEACWGDEQAPTSATQDPAASADVMTAAALRC
jgi:hypothetical protein